MSYQLYDALLDAGASEGKAKASAARLRNECRRHVWAGGTSAASSMSSMAKSKYLRWPPRDLRCGALHKL